MARDLAEAMTDDVFTLGPDRGVFLQHGGLRRRKDAIEATKHGKRQDDLTIFVALVRSPEQVADAPDEIGKLGMRFGVHG